MKENEIKDYTDRKNSENLCNAKIYNLLVVIIIHPDYKIFVFITKNLIDQLAILYF